MAEVLVTRAATDHGPEAVPVVSSPELYGLGEPVVIRQLSDIGRSTTVEVYNANGWGWNTEVEEFSEGTQDTTGDAHETTFIIDTSSEFADLYRLKPGVTEDDVIRRPVNGRPYYIFEAKKADHLTPRQKLQRGSEVKFKSVNGKVWETDVAIL